MQYEDPNLALSNYFPRNVQTINRDIARYIADNLEAFNDHFNETVRRWIKNLERAMEKKEEKAKRLKIITAVLVIVLTILSAGLLSVVLTSIAQAATEIHTAKMLTQAQVNAMKKMMEVMGITEAQIEAFRLWLFAKTDLGAQAPPTRTEQSGKYSVFVEGELVANSNDPKAALQVGIQKSVVGNRITLKDEDTGEAIGVLLRDKDGLKEVPPDMAGKVQALSADAATRAAGGDGFPWWILIPIGAAVL
jgi:flagellar basal body-associated protein FliL